MMNPVEPISLSDLKNCRNRIIGNRAAKVQLGRDTSQVTLILQCLSRDASTEAKIEAARIVSSLSYGGSDSLTSLLSCGALHVVIQALSYVTSPEKHSSKTPPPGRETSSTSQKLLVALLRALRSIASACADLVGPSLWGLAEEQDDSTVLKSAARAAIAEMLSQESLDLILPYLSISTTSKSASTPKTLATEIASVLGNVVRTPEQQNVVLDWLPPDQRSSVPRGVGSGRSSVRRSSSGAWGQPRSPSASAWSRGPPSSVVPPSIPIGKDRSRVPATSPVRPPKRAWDAPMTPVHAPVHEAGWIVTQLVGIIRDTTDRDRKLLEACLFTISALARDSRDISNFISSVVGGESVLTTILDHATSLRSPHIQVAACLAYDYLFECVQTAADRLHRATHVVRALPQQPNQHHLHPLASHIDPSQPSDAEQVILEVLSMLISASSDESRSDLDDDDSRLHLRFHSDHPTWEEEARVRERACFTLQVLVKDSAQLVSLAYERGVVRTLVRVIRLITPLPPASEEYDAATHHSIPLPTDRTRENPLMMDDEPLAVSRLREAALTALSTLCIVSHEVRRIAVEDHPAASAASSSPSPSPSLQSTNLGILPHITRSYYHPSVGVRYAALQCVRALARSVAVMRTSVSDSGAVEIVWEVVVREADALRRSLASAKGKGPGADTDDEGSPPGKGSEWEDKRVVIAAMQAMVNLVNDFSPVKQVYIGKGIVNRISVFLTTEDIPGLEPKFRYYALWIYKNLLMRSTMIIIDKIMAGVEWKRLRIYLQENVDEKVREQAFNILCNVAVEADGIDMVYSNLGPETILGWVCSALEGNDTTISRQAAALLGNLANGTPKYPCSTLLTTTPVTSLLNGPPSDAAASSPSIRLLTAIRHALTEHAKLDIRKSLTKVLSSFATQGHKERKVVLEAGIGSTLRKICEWSGKEPGLPSSSSGPKGQGFGASGVFDDERELAELARHVLEKLEHGGMD